MQSVNGHKAVRPDDLRTVSGRSREERVALKALRRAYVDAHPEMPVDAIVDHFRATGWFSPKTVRIDARRTIQHLRDGKG